MVVALVLVLVGADRAGARPEQLATQRAAQQRRSLKNKVLRRRGPPDFSTPALPITGPRAPWRARRRVGVKMRAKGQGLLELSRWPAEPPAPERIDPERLAKALRQMCGWMPPKRPRRWAGYLIKYGRQFGVDPFLLGGLVYRQSMCLHRSGDGYGTGLMRINGAMHRDFVRKRRYRYWVLERGAWRQRSLKLDRFLFYDRSFKRAEPSIYFAAALLSIYQAQCPAIDGAFGSVPHRHFVSHLIWGDKVRDAGPEDRALRSRRRLLQYYHDRLPEARGDFEGLALRCPLDAPPRKVTSVMGDDRTEGQRRHKGIDFSSNWGEPVRAVAAGRVIKAGVDYRRGPSRNLEPKAAKAVPRGQMGAGGLFVMIRHPKGLVSAYMHLSSYEVKQGDQVAAGQRIGHVGRSGMKQSPAHLHFELRHRGRHIDPVPHLDKTVFLPKDSYLGRKLAWEQRRVRRRRRIQRWREHKARLKREQGN